ncbi:MAG: heme-binding protein [Pseudomonadales bacterium]|nr:heme-binding protein [Pseudomonadales bacterium]
MALEKPEYQVLYEDGRIEYRLYEPYVVAETKVALDRSYNRASNQGFRRLFQYITGNNIADADIDMTAPVQMAMATEGEEIAMTAPVQNSVTDYYLQVAFMLPSKYTLESAPSPLDENVGLRQIPGRLMAVVRYSGRWTESNREKYEVRLREAIEQNGIEILSEAESAAYNPPFTPPFMRRNEIMLEVSTFPE